jgi:hypothetical protein
MNAQGRLFGLFRIDPIDDFVHLLSGVAGALVVSLAPARIPLYFIVIGVLYDLDALVERRCGMFTRRACHTQAFRPSSYQRIKV